MPPVPMSVESFLLEYAETRIPVGMSRRIITKLHIKWSGFCKYAGQGIRTRVKVPGSKSKRILPIQFVDSDATRQ